MSRRPKSAANVTCVLRRLACLALASSLLVAAPQLSAQPRLLLAGGHLPVCSSAAPSACKPGAVPQAPVASTRRYRLDDAGIARVAARGWLAQRSAARDRILAALRHWHRRAGEVDVDPERLARKLDAHEPERGVGAWSALAEFERERVLDALEREPLRERIDLAASLAQSGVPVYREFVAMARAVSGREAPHVLISTASGRDPFESIDYYRAVFEQAGAEVRWLPLDHALRAAQDHPKRDCARLDELRGERLAGHDRARLYPARAAELAAACRDPARLQALIDWADGVFLNGGDQSFTRAAWFRAGGEPSTALERLLERLDAGRLVLGGTSAGTAVQAARPAGGVAAMIVSGASLPASAALAIGSLPPYPGCALAQACQGIAADALLYHPGGGLGSFTPGVLDTHFAQRGRDYRLARLLLDAGIELGVGIDETTALRVDVDDGQWRGRVLGSGSVTVLQRIDAHLLLRRRYASGETVDLPPTTPAVPVCREAQLTTTALPADGAELARWLDALPTDARWHRLRLSDGTRTQDAGALCAPTGPRERWWRQTGDTQQVDASE